MDHGLLEIAINEQQSDFLSLPDNTLTRTLDLDLIFNGIETVVITGVRRCGKSFLMQLIAEKVKTVADVFYVDFDDPRLTSFASGDFQTLYELCLKKRSDDSKMLYLFFDEPQNIEGWEKWVTYLSKQRNQKVVVSGSNSKMLSSDLATHLTGRHREISLYPLSFSETMRSLHKGSTSKIKTSQSRATDQKLLDLYFKYGGFPRVYLDRDPTLLAQYFKDIIFKDIAPRKGAPSPRELLELGTTLMSSNSRLVNKSKLAVQLGFKQQRTMTNHIQFFLDAFLLAEIRKFDASVRKQQRSLPKYYAVDPVLAREVGFRVLEDKSSTLENFVFLELLRKGYEVFYWNSKEGYEVDFIARRMGSVTQAVQVCLSATEPSTLERECRALISVHEELRLTSLTMVTLNQRQTYKVGKAIVDVIPFVDWVVMEHGCQAGADYT